MEDEKYHISTFMYLETIFLMKQILYNNAVLTPIYSFPPKCGRLENITKKQVQLNVQQNKITDDFCVINLIDELWLMNYITVTTSDWDALEGEYY